MKLTVKILAFLIITIIVFFSAVIILALDSTAQFTNKNTVNVQAVNQSKRAAKRSLAALKAKNPITIITLSQVELNGLNALLHRAFPEVVSDITIEKKHVKINATIELPLPRFFKYLNVSTSLNPSAEGINLGDVSIGNITLNGNKLISLACWVVDSFVQEELGTQLVNMVKWVTVSPNKMHVSLVIPEDLNQLKSEKSGLLVLRDNLALFGDVTKIKFYHQALVNHIEQSGKIGNLNTELSYYLQFILSLSQEKTASNIDNINETHAIQENYSALMALALYFGTDSFEVLIGEVSSFTNSQQVSRQQLMQKVTLRNRVDLQKHFIYSVALQLFGNTQTSDAIGELKEFLDSNPGGSGFSFADLMADRAGTRFAKLATLNEESALKLQSQITKPFYEDDFMPEITDIPEGISAKVFNVNYRDVESSEYKKMISILDGRLSKLTVFK